MSEKLIFDRTQLIRDKNQIALELVHCHVESKEKRAEVQITNNVSKHVSQTESEKKKEQ